MNGITVLIDRLIERGRYVAAWLVCSAGVSAVLLALIGFVAWMMPTEEGPPKRDRIYIGVVLAEDIDGHGTHASEHFVQDDHGGDYFEIDMSHVWGRFFGKGGMRHCEQERDEWRDLAVAFAGLYRELKPERACVVDCGDPLIPWCIGPVWEL